MKTNIISTIVTGFLLQAIVRAEAPPLLDIRRAGNRVELKWPAADTRWKLQFADSLKSGPWTDVTEAPTVAGPDHILLQNVMAAPRWFRLACGAVDAPDGAYIDSNCDGIDGDAARAIFVSALLGDDAHPGTRAQPMATLQAAIDRAAATNKDVYAGAGTYVIDGTLHLRNGVSLYGQYCPELDWSRSPACVTTLAGGTTVLLGENLTTDIRVEGFTIRAADATLPGASSYGVRLLENTGRVSLRHNRIEAGTGAAGGSGQDFPAGVGGADGGHGMAGRPDESNALVSGGAGGVSAAGRPGGSGGNGGRNPSFTGSMGMAGTGGTPGGSGGSGGNPGAAGANGQSAAAGSSGANGEAGAAFGSISATGFYAPADGTNGTNGAPGNGGGGGGGGGGQEGPFVVDGAGNGGGGGGGGGMGGTAGTGGAGGGGSFGILAVNANALIESNILITRNGGAGGDGGDGGLGGPGGEGGNGARIEPTQIGRGGDGGDGGRGGHAGSGGGGGGGPSVGIQIVGGGGGVTQSGNTFTIGSGGPGGAGGANTGSTAPAGNAGATASVR